MCGLTGFIDYSLSSSTNEISKMTNAISHRGPDNKGSTFIKKNNYCLGLGHARLSILDLSNSANQPFRHNNLEMIYNGEVYNFKEIRSELIINGYDFYTDSDTEVILKSFEFWGINFVKKLNGMFSIIIFDSLQNKIFLIRDRAGVKPLYYYWDQKILIFASELKCFHKHPMFNKQISNEGLSTYLKYGFIPAPLSIFSNTFKLDQGCYIEFQLMDKKLIEKKYWDVSEFYQKPKLNYNESEIIKKVKIKLSKAFNLRLISDVPVGVFLSGGYDSAAVTSILSKNNPSLKLNTFTIGFKKKALDESVYARKIAEIFDTNHHECLFEKKDLLEAFNMQPFVWDEPLSDKSTLPTLLLSKFASKHVKVALSADGGDELFGGYNKYPNILSKLENNKFLNFIKLDKLGKVLNNSKISRIIYNDIGSRIQRYTNSTGHNSAEILNLSSSIFTDLDLKLLLNNEKKSKKNINFFQTENISDDLDILMNLDYKIYQSNNILAKVDRATMAYGLEGREPLLDFNLIEFIAKIPSKIKYKNNTLKYILKQIVHENIPQNLIDRPKKGFSISIIDALQNDLDSIVRYFFNATFIKKQGIFNEKYLTSIYNRFRKGDIIFANKIWNILIFQMWYKEWIK